MSASRQDQEILDAATDIQEYLDKHPQSADTLEGVTNWWLPRQHWEKAMIIVSKALDHLVRIGIVEKLGKKDGRPVYRKRRTASPRNLNHTFIQTWKRRRMP